MHVITLVCIWCPYRLPALTVVHLRVRSRHLPLWCFPHTYLDNGTCCASWCSSSARFEQEDTRDSQDHSMGTGEVVGLTLCNRWDGLTDEPKISHKCKKNITGPQSLTCAVDTPDYEALSPHSISSLERSLIKYPARKAHLRGDNFVKTTETFRSLI